MMVSNFNVKTHTNRIYFSLIGDRGEHIEKIIAIVYIMKTFNDT